MKIYLKRRYSVISITRTYNMQSKSQQFYDCLFSVMGHFTWSHILCLLIKVIEAIYRIDCNFVVSLTQFLVRDSFMHFQWNQSSSECQCEWTKSQPAE